MSEPNEKQQEEKRKPSKLVKFITLLFIFLSALLLGYFYYELNSIEHLPSDPGVFDRGVLSYLPTVFPTKG